MTITVSFVRPSELTSYPGIGINQVRKMETLAVGGTTTTVAEDGEFIVIGNDESSMIRAAIGTAPDADATSENGTVTTAGYPIGAGQVSDPFVGLAGAKVNVELAD